MRPVEREHGHDPASSKLRSGLIEPERPSRRRLLRSAFGAGAALLAARAGLARAEPIDYAWVTTTWATPLRLDAAGTEVRWLPRGTLLRVAGDASGPRMHAWCPAFATFGSVETAAVEDAPAPTEAALLAQRVAPMSPPVLFAGELPARIVGSGNLRAWPEDRRDTFVRFLSHNAEVVVVEVVQGEDGDPWYRLAETVAGPKAPRGAAFFIHHSFVRVPRVDFHPTPRNPDRMPTAWFEADLEQPAILTAYDAGRPVWSSLVLHGKIGEVTPLGEHRILWRVPRETMTSERVHPPKPRYAPGGYYLENVLWTQYFDRNGAAIHYNYWASNWGYRASRGCLGLPLAESKWAWDFAEPGTPIKIFV